MQPGAVLTEEHVRDVLLALHAMVAVSVRSLLSKSAVHEAGVERAVYDADAVAKLHHITVEANPCDKDSAASSISCSSFFHGPNSNAPSRTRRPSGMRAALRAGTNLSRCSSPNSGARSRSARSAAAGELRGQAGASRGGGSPSVDARVRQCPPAVGPLSNGVLPGPGTVSRGRRGQTLPVQERTPQSRRHGDRLVRGDVSVGGVSPHQRRGRDWRVVQSRLQLVEALDRFRTLHPQKLAA